MVFQLVFYTTMFHFSAEETKGNLVEMHFLNEQFRYAQQPAFKRFYQQDSTHLGIHR